MKLFISRKYRARLMEMGLTSAGPILGFMVENAEGEGCGSIMLPFSKEEAETYTPAQRRAIADSLFRRVEISVAVRRLDADEDETEEAEERTAPIEAAGDILRQIFGVVDGDKREDTDP